MTLNNEKTNEIPLLLNQNQLLNRGWHERQAGLSRCGCALCRSIGGGGNDTGGPNPAQNNDPNSPVLSVTTFPGTSVTGSGNTWSGISSGPYIQGLIHTRKWGTGDPDTVTSTNLKYYLYDNESLNFNYATNRTTNPFDGQAITTAEKGAITSTMDAFASVSGLTFTETSTKSEANLAWALLNSTDSNQIVNGLLGVARFPGTDSNPDYGGGGGSAVIVNKSYLTSTARTTPGSYYYLTFTHELGHAIGLKHPHDSGGSNQPLFPGVTSSSNGGDNNLNATPWTVMTYNDATATNELSPRNNGAGYLTNIGAFDIAAIQYLYGPNNSTQSGNSTYSLSNSANGFTTIWDAGGTDEISASGLSTAVTIDLRNATLANEAGGGGFVSRIGSEYKGFVIAYDSTGNAIIENATGGNGNDALRGNNSANILDGKNGKDVCL